MKKVFITKGFTKSIIVYILIASFALFIGGCKKNITDNQTDDLVDSKEDDVVDSIDDHLEDYDYFLKIDGTSAYEISDKLYGLFLEDINYAIDGGIYAEMIKNRSFEFGSMATKGSKHGWTSLGEIEFDIIDGFADKSYLNENNQNYARITNESDLLAGIGNSGFLDGIAINENATYDFSGYFKASNYNANITVSLQDDKGNIYGETKIDGIKDKWQKYEAKLTSSESISDKLSLYILIDKGSIDMDMISLFPTQTYKGRKNGIRKDIGEMLEGLSPKFLRFPGGCIVEGKTLESAYDWKASIGYGNEFNINGQKTYGDVATRPLGINLWGNPAVALEIGSDEFNAYIQDALDLIEFANGDSNTKWGAIRIGMGHEEAFNVKYLGIGNEQWGNVYFSRYEAFKLAFEEAAKINPSLYGDIKLIVANGPIASDKHAWNKIKLQGKDYAALAEAAFMTGLERNGDIVELASYAPLFGNSIAVQWTPDLIWFNNNKVWGSANYYVQKIFANNVGKKVLDTTLTGDVIYIGDEKWTNYTLTLTATKTAGSEGFIIPIAVKDKNNSYHWNIGGWANTVSCLEEISAGNKSGQIECYLDGAKMISYKIPKVEAIYQVSGLGEDGNLIVKIVNVSSEVRKIKISFDNIDVKKANAKLSLLAADAPLDVNSEMETENIKIDKTNIEIKNEFIYEAPKYSVSVLDVPLN